MLARAWKEQEEIKRKIKGKADPKPVDVSPEAKAKRARKLINVSAQAGDADPSAK